MRRSLWLLSVAPAWAGSAIVFLVIRPWRPAVGHLILLGLFGVMVAELCLQGDQKIPFTCSWLPGKSKFHIAFWAGVIFILEIVLQGAELEQRALQNPAGYAILFLTLAAIAVSAAWRTSRSAEAETERLQFEETPPWQLTRLDL
jgi:hypothetical protein